MRIHTDGGARGNPGPAACAFVATDDRGHLIHQQGFYLGIATNNQAEYQAVIAALKWVSTLDPQPPALNFYLDSQLVVNQLQGNFKIKNQSLKIKKLKILELIKNYKLKIKNFVYIPRSQNAAADLLVNQTLDNHS
ncbi:MAG: Ribonuclease H [Candidatus Amesbacteria bacterium GW2011_GWA2_47_11b]|uniref:Ribonuclease H n=3 Tax=Candidatus Amesiibacteriota TaxID=1752730 RepID=A0A0G1SI69_9BACT|nr:MAG: Ribonuclease H [Candidatus Amesbacteria bacterium GW2011_GWA2_47_11b]KKU69129.1 MAG: Ribonuclease H [Candidatus Amesbacteria bacterium GW2011_GWA1_47_20]KKU83806.1 MAG: Ribonuclease H [Candidatus Amesbacteria bacterium GW2011_GWC2_47_8]